MTVIYLPNLAAASGSRRRGGLPVAPQQKRNPAAALLGLTRFTAIVFCLLFAITHSASAQPASTQAATQPAATQPAGDSSPPGPTTIRVGKLVYAGGKSVICFSEGFLRDLQRQSSCDIDDQLHPVALSADDLHAYPLLIFSGSGAFTLSETEEKNLARYLERGGTLLASASCADTSWARSFEKTLGRILPRLRLRELPISHPIFHQLYDIEEVQLWNSQSQAVILGGEMGRRLAVIYSPIGLNDTANAGKGCCCCGGNEIRNARPINANLVLYALTH